MEINWSGYKWITQERWGLTHPEKPKWWYDDTAIDIDDKEYIHLKTHRNPKSFPGVNPQIGVGLISNKTKFSHGTFEIEAKLPTGKWLWPAFWMYSWDDMTPEIDAMEAYTYGDNGYSTWNIFKLWNVKTNLFYKQNGSLKSIGGSTHWWGFKNPRNNFIKYKLEWFPNSINYYYDNRLVRKIKDKNILNHFNTTTMNVLINNGIDNDCKGIPTSDFIIKYFKYTDFK